MKLRDILQLPIEDRYETLATVTWPNIDLQRYAMYHVVIGSTPQDDAEWDTENGDVHKWLTEVFNPNNP